MAATSLGSMLQCLTIMMNAFHVEILADIQEKLPLLQLEAIASRPITCHLRKDISTFLVVTSF